MDCCYEGGGHLFFETASSGIKVHEEDLGWEAAEGDWSRVTFWNEDPTVMPRYYVEPCLRFGREDSFGAFQVRGGIAGTVTTWPADYFFPGCQAQYAYKITTGESASSV